nr:MAG TPA: hypothetical protein [Caudoviricetes sp.]
MLFFFLIQLLLLFELGKHVMDLYSQLRNT